MPVAFTNSAITFTTLRCDTSANLRSDLDAALLGVGWSHQSAVTNGFLYKLVSPAPQSLVAYCEIADRGSTFGPLSKPCISIRFKTSGGSYGYEHLLSYGQAEFSAKGYQLVANCCQLFISLPGVVSGVVGGATSNFAYSVCGGVPSLPTNVSAMCTTNVTSPTVTELWWSNGSAGSSAFGVELNFRNTRWCEDSWSTSYNGSLTFGNSAVDSAYTGSLRIYPVTATQNVDLFSNIPPRAVKYSLSGANQGGPIFYDALVGWNFTIYGQIWDAFVMSRDRVVDDVYTSSEVDASGQPYTATWINYMGDVMPDNSQGGDHNWFSSLYLLTGSPSQGSNYVY